MSVRQKRRAIKAFLHNQKGLAATEFGLLTPILITLFFGLVEASDAMTMNRRIHLATNTLADLVAQTEQVTTSELDSLFTGVLEILEPNDTSVVDIKLISVVPDADGDPVVDWSYDESGAEPYAPGSDFTALKDATLLSPSASLVVVEMQYPYTPSITNFLFQSPITFQRQTSRWPRVSTRVTYCGATCT